MRHIDMYGDPITIHFACESLVKSTFGGILSIVTMIFMIFYLYMTSMDIFLRQDPKMYQETQTLAIAHNFTLTRKNFTFYVNLFDSNRTVIREKNDIYLNFALKRRRKINDTYKIETQNVELRNCREEDIIYLVDNQIKRNILDNYLCPNITELNLFGANIDDDSRYGQIQVYPCNFNNTNQVRNCSSDEMIEKSIWENKILFSIYYAVPVVKLNNYFNPFETALKEDYFYLGHSIKSYRFVNYGIELLNLKTDPGYITNMSDETNIVQFRPILTDTRTITNYDPFFFSIDIKSTRTLIQYQRSYIKLLDIISNFGGMLQILQVFFQFIVSIFSALERVGFMTNKIFILKDYKNSSKLNLKNHILSDSSNIKLNTNKINKTSNIYKNNINADNYYNKVDDIANSSNINSPFGKDNLDKTIELKNIKDIENENSQDLNKKVIRDKDDIVLNDNLKEKIRQKLDFSNSISYNKDSKMSSMNKESEKKLNNDSNNEKSYLAKVNNIYKKETSDYVDLHLKNIIDYDHKVKKELLLFDQNEILEKIFNRKKSEKLNLNCCQKFHFNFLKTFNIGKKENTYNYNLSNFISVIHKKIRSLFDYLKVIDNLEDMKLIKKLLFDKYQNVFIGLLRKRTLHFHQQSDMNNLKEPYEISYGEVPSDENIIYAVNKLKENHLYEKSENQNSFKFDYKFIDLFG